MCRKPLVQVAGRHVDARLGQVANEVEAMQKAIQESKTAAKEEQEKETRRNNIIMYRVSESDAAFLNDRNAADKRLVEQVLFGLNVGISEDNIRKVVRLGKRVDTEGRRPEGDSSGAQQTSRPILVQLGGQMAKNLIMESLFIQKALPERQGRKEMSVRHW